MLDRLEPYDFLGIAVPGVLLAYWLPVCFPQAVEIVAVADLPGATDVVGFAAVAILFGHLIQSVASALEPILYLTWGGTPSVRALSQGLGQRYVSEAAGKRIRERLMTVALAGASHQDIFHVAMARANGATGSRTERFNALYAYHRALVVVVIVATLLLGASRLWGAAASWPEIQFRVVLGVLLSILVLVWHRAKQRAFYFVRETLLVAERTVASTPTSTTSLPKEASQ